MTHNQTYFVTGASGFIGRELCKKLIQSKARVKVLIRQNDDELLKLGVKIWIGDLFDKKKLKEAVKDADIVIHCAGDARFGDGSHYNKANVELTRLIIEATKHAKQSVKFMFISTMGAVDRSNNDNCTEPLDENSPTFPSSDYGKSKLKAEAIVKESNIPYIIIRPSTVVGESMRQNSHFSFFANKSFLNSFFYRIAWPGEFSVIHISDLISAILFLAIHPGAVGNIFFCAGDKITLSNFFKLCNPQKKQISIKPLISIIRLFYYFLPFKFKAIIFPALVASDRKLKELGWQSKFSAVSALISVINRERVRLNPELSPSGQTIITGAASGLGLALAKRLAPIRSRILLIDQDKNGLKKITAKFKNCIGYNIDLANEEELNKLFSSVEWNFSDISEVFACAGIGLRGKMQNISYEGHKKMFAINVLSRIAIAKRAFESMKRKNFGRIIFISSSSAFQPLPLMATYAATNSALLSIGEAWSEEITDDGIQLLTICPGGMKTNFQKTGGIRQIDGERLMAPEKVVGLILSGIRLQRQTIIVSFRSFAMSLLARSLPRRLSVKLWGVMMEKMR